MAAPTAVPTAAPTAEQAAAPTAEQAAAPTDEQAAVPARRTFLQAAAAGLTAVATAPAGVALAAPAAAAAPQKVTKFVALAYRYDRLTRRTTVTKERRTTVTARPVTAYGRTVYQQRTPSGAWTLVPYVWSSKKKGLVYDHGLQLQLVRTTSARATVPYVTKDLDRHLLRRATFGAAPGALAELKKLGRDAWLDRQLAPATIDDSACETWLRNSFRFMDAPIWQVNDALDNGDLSGWEHSRDVAAYQLARQCWSKRQLLEVMVEFWSQHFNVDVWHDGVTATRAHYSRTLRARALGRFRDLLWAVTTHPAMLVYLDNAESDDAHPNENLGRELLELHTVGVGSTYGERGVLTSARILTGLSVSRDSGEFLYQPWKHWTGRVSVLGFTDANASRTDGLAVARRFVAHLASHPDTARRLARRLAVLFVSDAPPDSLVDRLAKVYLAHDTDIRPVLRDLLTSPEFEASVGAKVRRPQEYLASVVRVLGMRPTLTGAAGAASDLAWKLDEAGMYPLSRSTPDGYPLPSAAWLSTSALIGRWNGAMSVVQGWTASSTLVRPDRQELLFGGTVPATCGAAVDAAARTLFGTTMLPADRDALLRIGGWTASTPVDDADGFLAWRFDDWLTAMLQSPYQLTA